MNKSSSTLIVALALLAVGSCGEQESATETTVTTASNVPETPIAQASDESLAQEENDLDLSAAQEKEDLAPSTAQDVEEPAGGAAFDAKNSKFTLDGETVVLKNGVSKVSAAPGSASVVTTRYLGKEARGDLTRDGKEDIAYFVTRDAAGSGVFYYAVVAINGKNGYKTTNAFLVGDRIKPQSLRINSNELHVAFGGREKGQPMTTPPSVDSVLLLKVTQKGVLEGLMK